MTKTRLPALLPDALDAAQQRVFDKLRSGKRKGIRGPWLTLLHAPEICDRLETVGHYLKFESALPDRLVETTVLVLVEHLQCDAARRLHLPIARRAGLSPEITDAIAARRRPPFAADDPAGAVYDFCTELLKTNRVSDDTYARTRAAIGDGPLVEMIVLLGYYSVFAFALNTHPAPPPVGPPPGDSPDVL